MRYGYNLKSVIFKLILRWIYVKWLFNISSGNKPLPPNGTSEAGHCFLFDWRVHFQQQGKTSVAFLTQESHMQYIPRNMHTVFALLCFVVVIHWLIFPIPIRLTSLALWQSNDCPSASKATLMNMDKHFMWIHYKRLHNHNKTKHNETVCTFLGIYCISTLGAYHGASFVNSVVKMTARYRKYVL